MNEDVQGRPFFTNCGIPLKQIHVALRRVARLANHDDVIHVVGSAFAPWENVVFRQLRRLHFLAAIPAIVVLLNLRHIELQQVVYVPASFLISLECLGSYHIAGTVVLLLAHIQRSTKHLEISIRPKQVFTKVGEL